MKDPRYQYEKVTAVKVIVENPNGKILLIQEPKTNEWMPGHWGLPGGKPLEKESLVTAFKRKMKEELGQEIEAQGIVRIEELLIEGRTVLMFILLAKTESGDVVGQNKSHKWVEKTDIEKMKTKEFTEFYNKKLLLEFFDKKYNLAPLSLLDSLKFYELVGDSEYKAWFESGKRNLES